MMTFCSILSNFHFKIFGSRIFLVPSGTIFVCFETIFWSRTFFVPFGNFVELDSTPTRRATIKLLLGSLGRARGQKGPI